MRGEFMTVKEIASAVNKTERTVRNWIKKSIEINPDITENMAEKTSVGSVVYPAEFDLEESLLIIKTGLGKNMANLYRNNFEKQPTQNVQVNSYVTKSDLTEFGKSIVSEMFKQVIPMIQSNNQNQIEFKQDYYSIKGYANKLNIQIKFSEAISLGKIAGKLSREKGVDIRKVEDERFGYVNSYSVDILKEIFEA